MQSNQRRVSQSSFLGFRACALVVLIAGAGSACSSSPTKSATVASPTPIEQSGFLEASPELARKIEIKAMEATLIQSSDDFIRLSDWFQTIGEPAYPKLIEMAQSTDRMTKSLSFSVMSSLRDTRLLAPLKEAMPLSAVPSQNHRYEMARALLNMGDMEGVPVLIDGLEDANVKARAQAHRALSQGTRANIPFQAGGSPEERAQSVQAWRTWWQGVAADPLLD